MPYHIQLLKQLEAQYLNKIIKMIGTQSPQRLLPKPSLKRNNQSSETCEESSFPNDLGKKKMPRFFQAQKGKSNSPEKSLKMDYKDIEQCPTYHLTPRDMMEDPITLFKRLEVNFSQYGAIKLKACNEWNPPFCFKYIDKKLTTRVQVLSDLKHGKAFEQKIESYFVKDFENYAVNFQNKYQYHTDPKGKTTQEKNEEEFWALVTNPQYEKLKLKVQYAADLPVSKYGSGFPLSKHSNAPGPQMQYEKNLYNLNNIYKSKESLLRIIKNKSERISGVTSPWMYIGMMFSSFCWHIEDLYINSLNYNHQGSTKTWYIVPRSQKEKFDEYAKKKFSKAFETKPDILHRITWMLDPLELIRNGINVRKINQQERCYVLTFSKAYHSGFSHGFNVGEAVNFVTSLVLNDIKQAGLDYRELKGKKTAIFPYQWLIFENCKGEFFKDLEESDRQLLLYQRDSIIAIETDNIKRVITDLAIKYYSYIQAKCLKYDKNICSGCKAYCYLSFVQCEKCNKKYCFEERSECCSAAWRLVIRQPQQERADLELLLKERQMTLKEINPL